MYKGRKYYKRLDFLSCLCYYNLCLLKLIKLNRSEMLYFGHAAAGSVRQYAANHVRRETEQH